MSGRGSRHRWSPARSAPWFRPRTDRVGSGGSSLLSGLKTFRDTCCGSLGPLAPPPRAMGGGPSGAIGTIFYPLPLCQLQARPGHPGFAETGRGNGERPGKQAARRCCLPPRPGPSGPASVSLSAASFPIPSRYRSPEPLYYRGASGGVELRAPQLRAAFFGGGGWGQSVLGGLVLKLCSQ